MPTWAHNPLTGGWVLQAPDRRERPRGASTWQQRCPFCPGSEGDTPAETDRVERDGEWQVRAFPNLYPAVAASRAPVRTTAPGAPVTGAHEVVVLSPSHTRTLADLDRDDARLAVGMLLRRVCAHLAEGHAYAQAFINQGEAAGASIRHPHGQVLAIDVVPPLVRRERDALRAGSCAICGLFASGAAVLVEADVAAVSPPWAALPFELLVAPRSHNTPIDEGIADVVAEVLRRVRAECGDIAYNVVFHPGVVFHSGVAPQPQGVVEVAEAAEYKAHPHVHVYPRMEADAGFELGTGLRINSTSPEHVRSRLRQVR